LQLVDVHRLEMGASPVKAEIILSQEAIGTAPGIDRPCGLP
jgi:hypothetical protein